VLVGHGCLPQAPVPFTAVLSAYQAALVGPIPGESQLELGTRLGCGRRECKWDPTKIFSLSRLKQQPTDCQRVPEHDSRRNDHASNL
jgi:hypothetical protein